jgi:hypothetical protein
LYRLGQARFAAASAVAVGGQTSDSDPGRVRITCSRGLPPHIDERLVSIPVRKLARV